MIAAFEDELRLLGYADPDRLIVEKRVFRSNTSETRGHATELARMALELVSTCRPACCRRQMSCCRSAVAINSSNTPVAHCVLDTLNRGVRLGPRS
jgi:hypothetical protein